VIESGPSLREAGDWTAWSVTRPVFIPISIEIFLE
jgi:hypothetical protein